MPSNFKIRALWQILTVVLFICINTTYSASCKCKTCCNWNFYVACLDPCYEYWNSWGSYSSCSATCGGGTQSRRRSCPCGGSDTEYKACNTNCLNDGQYYGGSCQCSQWRYGRCCEGNTLVKFIYNTLQVYLLFNSYNTHRVS